MDTGHGLGESDIQTTEGTECCNKLEHIMNNEVVSPKIRLLTNEERWRSAPYISRQHIKCNPNPKFLGVTYDRQLNFCLHASIVGSKMKQQAGALRCLASTYWGYGKSILRSIYIAMSRSTVEYAAATRLFMGFDLNDGEAENVSEVCWKSNLWTNQDDSCRSDFSRS